VGIDTEEKAGKPSPAAQLSALESWREKVLRGFLTVGAIVSPVIVVASLGLRSVPLSMPRTLALIGAALAFPLLRLAPGLSVTVRASLSIALSFVTGVGALMTFGFSSGPGIVLAGTSIFAVIFLGRAPGFLLIGLSLGAYLAAGTLISRGVVAIDAADLDPYGMQNWARIGVTFAFLTVLLTTAIDLVIRHVEHSSRAAADALNDLRTAYERLALLNERFDTAKEDERRFIAHELHDELGQMLTVVKLRLSMRAARDGTRITSDETRETFALIDGMIERIRKISSDLRPPLLDEVGLFPALRVYVDAQSALSGVPIELAADEVDGRRLDPDREISCFRVVQESLTNALRHGSPKLIRVSAVRRPTAISISIVDDGCGFDTATLAGTAARHLGIVGMQERARARGGSFLIRSEPGAGTRVDVEMPIEP
jgi:signal transduction histidine kinase